MVHAIIIIAFLGVIAYIVKLLPIPQLFKTIIFCLLGFTAALVGLEALGINTGFSHIRLNQ